LKTGEEMVEVSAGN